MNNGIYIHIPFCVKKCNYCDFNSYDNINHLKKAYTDELIKEIKSRLPDDYDTVFIGGGTPTSLPLDLLLDIIGCVAKKGCEFTVEVNPATIDEYGFSMLKRAGVNRISLGLQSAVEEELSLLGRIHSFDDFSASYKAARNAGFDNVNVDLMFAIPDQTFESFRRSLEAVADLKPEHISCYSLMIEENTPFFNMRLNLPPEEEERRMYHLCVHYLKGRGYNHYEISNFAMDGFECRHNLKYWQREPYFGFGAGAHSLVGNIRYKNSESVSEYINSNVQAKTYLSKKDIEKEYIFLGLRKTSGISLDHYKAQFGRDFLIRYSAQIEKYKDFCLVSADRFFLNLDGLTVSNTILSDFME